MTKSEAAEYFKNADSLYRSGRYYEAMAILEELDKSFPNTKNVLYPKALCLAALGRVDEAEYIGAFLKRSFNDRRCAQLFQIITEKRNEAAAPALDGPDFDLMESITAAPPAPPQPVATPERNYLKYGLIAAGVLVVLAIFIVPLMTYSPDKAAQTAAKGAQATHRVVISADTLNDISEADWARFGKIFLFVILPFTLVLDFAPLYFALMVRKRLPFDTFMDNFLSTLGFAFIANLIALLLPCLGIFIGIYILYKRYELEFLDIVILVVAMIVFYPFQVIASRMLLSMFGFTFA